MKNIFSAKVNAFLAAVVTVAISLALTTAVYVHMRKKLIEMSELVIQSREDEYAPLFEAQQLIEDNFVGDTDNYVPVQAAVEGLVTGLDDRWSYYVSPDELQSYQENLNNSYVGIGITVTKDESGYIRVEAVAEGGGAHDAGIEVGDLIVTADGTDVIPLTLDECSAVIRGDEGTFVTLVVKKTDGTEAEYKVERRAIEAVIVTGQMIGSIGYIALDNFNMGSAKAFIEMTEQFIDAGAEALVFDMRFNGGGRLVELVEILDYLLPKGLIFRGVDNNGEEAVFHSDASCIDLPMAVLINGSSYSAAEFFAAALEQYGVAVTVGDATVGKGYAQNTYFLSDGSAIAISVYEYFTPDGTSLAGVGLTPTYEIALSDEDYVALYYDQLPIADDEQLQKALEVVMAR